MFVGDGTQFLQPGRARRNGAAFLIQEAEPQRLKHTCTAVIGGTAPNAHNKPAAAVADGVPQHLAHTVGGSPQRIPRLGRDQGNACRTGHFHHSGLAVRQDAVGTVCRCSHGAGDGDMMQRTAHAGDQSFHRSLSPVGQRPHLHPGGRVGAQNPLPDCRSRLQGRKASFQGIHGNDDFHKAGSFFVSCFSSIPQPVLQCHDF